jgi:hypothetical protein
LAGIDQRLFRYLGGRTFLDAFTGLYAGDPGDESRSSNDNAGYSIAEKHRSARGYARSMHAFIGHRFVGFKRSPELSEQIEEVDSGRRSIAFCVSGKNPACSSVSAEYVWTDGDNGLVFGVSGGNAETNMPIGRPLANTEMYILDQNQHPCPLEFPVSCILEEMALLGDIWTDPT